MRFVLDTGILIAALITNDTPARKNFLFADTAAGARSSGRIFSLIETARANGHHPQRYLSVLLTELPNVTDVDQLEALLSWNLTPAMVAERYAAYPAP